MLGSVGFMASLKFVFYIYS